MSHFVTLQELYNDYLPKKGPHPVILPPQTGHFNVFKRGDMLCKRLTQIHRTDFYKISLIIGSGILHTEEKSIEVNGSTLIFYNPDVAHLWESVSPKQDGYFCLFNKHFITPSLGESIFRHSPLVDANVNCVYPLSKEQASDMIFIFRKMMEEVDTDYVQKYDVLHHYLQVVLHHSHKMQPNATIAEKYTGASSRIASRFIELLERQFPVDSTEKELRLKSPHDFAERLSVHVNHLNRAVKEVMGKSTTEIISARIASEAQALLMHTDNSVAEIAYSLGFEHPSNFNIFFKKQTSKTPKMMRSRI